MQNQTLCPKYPTDMCLCICDTIQSDWIRESWLFLKFHRSFTRPLKCIPVQNKLWLSKWWMDKSMQSRALCWIKLLPVTHVLVDTWMLTVKPVYKLLNVSDDLKWTTNTHDTSFTHFQGITNNIYGFRRPSPVHHRPPYFYPSIFVFYPVGRVST